MTPRSLADVNVSETMFGHYYCIKSFWHMKTLEKRFINFILHCYNSARKHKRFEGFANACSRAKTNVILMSINYVHTYTHYC